MFRINYGLNDRKSKISKFYEIKIERMDDLIIAINAALMQAKRF